MQINNDTFNRFSGLASTFLHSCWENKRFTATIALTAIVALSAISSAVESYNQTRRVSKVEKILEDWKQTEKSICKDRAASSIEMAARGEGDSDERLSLTFLGLETLPDCFDCLPNVTELDVSHNSLQTLPPSIGNMRQLESLCFDNNQLQSVPNSFSNLTQLKRVWLNNNPQLKITDQDVLEAFRGKCVSTDSTSLTLQQQNTLQNVFYSQPSKG